MKRAVLRGLPCGLIVLLAPAVSAAHIEVDSGPGFAGTTQEITFGVEHGCSGADTLSIRIEIPPEVLSVRAEPSGLGPATVELDDAELPVAVMWEKSEEDLLDADTNYYKLTLLLKVPDQPFTTLYFTVEQVCQASDGTKTQVDWASTDPESDEEPAPDLSILPERFSGWNKYTLPEDIDDLSEFFSDALIVWRGDEAYSANPNTAELISNTSGVSELTALEADDEIWVKY